MTVIKYNIQSSFIDKYIYNIQSSFIDKYIYLSKKTYEPLHKKMYFLTWVLTKTQISLHRHAIRSVFVVFRKKLCILGYPKYIQWRSWSDWVNVQADLNHVSAHVQRYTFWCCGVYFGLTVNALLRQLELLHCGHSSGFLHTTCVR